MNLEERSREQLINDLRLAELEIEKLKEADDNYKKIAEALNQDRELYAELANALPSGVYRTRVFHGAGLIDEKWASSNDSLYVIEFANDRFFEILNLKRLDFEKNPGIINDLIFDADKAGFSRMNVEANLNVTPFVWEGRFMIKGKPKWIHFESTPRILSNFDILWTGTLYDISKRKNAELEIILKNKELEKLNAEKVRFLSIIAHDLKSPFNSIIGFSEILLEKIKERDYDQSGEIAATILLSSNRAMDLLKNLMEWSQLHTGRMEFSPEYYEVVALINEAIQFYTDIAIQKSITIKKDLPHFAKVYTDKAMIGTVFRNLISNAIKFTRPGGEILISAVLKQNEIIFSVHDTGVGIPKNSLGKLFRIDQSYSTSGTSKEKGTGLGLILCKEFVERQGGRIWVESEEGIGSTFCFTLPTEVNRAVTPERSRE